MNMAFYGVLTWYFDCVVPDEFGWSLPPWFFLMPEYWGLRRSGGVGGEREWLRGVLRGTKGVKVPGDEDKDVEEERKRALDECELGLFKFFGFWFFWVC